MSTPYNEAIGEAGARYLKSLVMSGDGERQLLRDPNETIPATFRWNDLWDTMNRAAGDPPFDVIQVFESWGAREANLTATLMDLVIGACVKAYVFDQADPPKAASLTIKTADLRGIVERYELTRTEGAGEWTITLRPLEMVSDGG